MKILFAALTLALAASSLFACKGKEAPRPAAAKEPSGQAREAPNQARADPGPVQAGAKENDPLAEAVRLAEKGDREGLRALLRLSEGGQGRVQKDARAELARLLYAEPEAWVAAFADAEHRGRVRKALSAGGFRPTDAMLKGILRTTGAGYSGKVLSDMSRLRKTYRRSRALHAQHAALVDDVAAHFRRQSR